MSENLILGGLLLLLVAFNLWCSKRERKATRSLCKNLYLLGIAHGMTEMLNDPSVSKRLDQLLEDKWREVCRSLDWEDDV